MDAEGGSFSLNTQSEFHKILHIHSPTESQTSVLQGKDVNTICNAKCVLQLHYHLKHRNKNLLNDGDSTICFVFVLLIQMHVVN